ncbi:MAG: ABC transporter permease subunit [Hyphomonas sp.]|nr:ABC transporter permease subunit [Hyphomonas sp.]
MVHMSRRARVASHLVLIVGLTISLGPIYVAFVAASHPVESFGEGVPIWFGDQIMENFAMAWQRGDFGQQLLNSTIVALIVTAGKCLLATTAAFSITYFQWPGRAVVFWLVLLTLMLPLEVRIIPSYEIAANLLDPVQTIANVTGLTALIEAVGGIRIDLKLSLLDSYAGLTLPLMATVTGTFLFRQFYLTIPDALVDAARLDGAGPFRFFIHILLPLSKTNLAALATISFIFGWNQYLWPLLITTEPEMRTAVIGLQAMIPGVDDLPLWNHAMAATLIVVTPPVAIVLLLQRWFVRGLVNSER